MIALQTIIIAAAKAKSVSTKVEKAPGSVSTKAEKASSMSVSTKAEKASSMSMRL